MTASPHLANWSGADIAAECSLAYNAYRAAKSDGYRAFFTAHQELRDEHHEYKARDLVSALPAGWAELTNYIPAPELHQQHLSGNSSQVLALGLLGVGQKLDPSLMWLWNGLGNLPSPTTPAPGCQFEARLQPELLGEQPRQTAIDFLVRDPAVVLALECKWAEAGIGTCSCGGDAAFTSECSEQVLGRETYWSTAKAVFNLPERKHGQPCPLSFTYQAVRNAAGACVLATDDQTPIFGLVYDAENPYFAGCGDWPGWPAALDASINESGSDLHFASTSWQELIELIPLDGAAREWASEKHGLHQDL